MKVEDIGFKTEMEMHKEIERLSMESPIIHSVMDCYLHAEISWERALMTMVLCLQDSNKELIKNATEILRNRPPQPVTIEGLSVQAGQDRNNEALNGGTDVETQTVIMGAEVQERGIIFQRGARRIWNKGDENLTEVKEAEKEIRLCVSCKAALVPTSYANGMLDGHLACPNAGCPRGWLLTASYITDGAKEFKEAREAKERAETFKQAHPKADEMDIVLPCGCEVSRDSIRTLYPMEDCGIHKHLLSGVMKAYPKLAEGAKSNCLLSNPENWPCQWAIPSTIASSRSFAEVEHPYHCPKICDHIMKMSDGRTWE